MLVNIFLQAGFVIVWRQKNFKLPIFKKLNQYDCRLAVFNLQRMNWPFNSLVVFLETKLRVSFHNLQHKEYEQCRQKKIHKMIT